MMDCCTWKYRGEIAARVTRSSEPALFLGVLPQNGLVRTVAHLLQDREIPDACPIFPIAENLVCMRDIIDALCPAATAAPSRPRELRTAPRIHVNPTQLFVKTLIETAFKDAGQTRNGRPTRTAFAAVRWIATRSDWTRTGHIPPPAIRHEFIGSFDWACANLGLDSEKVRMSGLGIGRLYSDDYSAGGLPHVLARWSGRPLRILQGRLMAKARTRT
jgi:hypothetical protein